MESVAMEEVISLCYAKSMFLLSYLRERGAFISRNETIKCD